MTDASSAPIDAAAIARGYDRAELLLRRWGGTVIDLVALFVVCLVLIALAGATRATAVALLVVIVIVVGYYPLTEGLWGRTLGKLATGTIIVDRQGRRASLGQVLIRTLLRLIEVNPFFLGGIPAGVAVLATEGKQRIGDLAAGTYVLPLKALKSAAPEIASVFA